MIGDSHTVTTFPMIAEILEENGYVVTSAVSNSGWDTYSFNNDPSDLVYGLSTDPDLIIVSLGGNNARLNDEKYGQDVSEFLKLIGYPKRKIIWIMPYFASKEDVQRRHLWTNNFYKRYLPSDIETIELMNYRFPLGSDGYHYPRSSYRSFVDATEKELLSKIKSQFGFVKKIFLISAIASIAIAIL